MVNSYRKSFDGTFCVVAKSLASVSSLAISLVLCREVSI